jgi:hypothetical protein
MSEPWRLSGFGVNMPGCRYEVRPCEETEPGAELVLKSEAGVLVTEKHELKNLFILPVDSEYVIITTVN